MFKNLMGKGQNNIGKTLLLILWLKKFNEEGAK
jgi:hypothetical protein